jgi:TRAP transporter TAXI family solute receptor
MKAFRIVAVLTTAFLVAGACAAPRAGDQPTTAPGTGTAAATPNFAGKPVNIVTGGTGGVYIIYGGGLANVLSNKLGVAATAQSTTASVDNMKFIRDKKADLAFTLADTALDAAKGRAQFASPEQPASGLRALTSLYANITHVVTKEGTGINTVADLKGKRVSVGSAGSGTEVIANRVLEAYNLTQADLQPQKLGVADSANGLRDGRLDAFFWSGGLPTAAVTDLANAPGITLKFLDHSDVVQKMADKYDKLYVNATLPANTYKNAAAVRVSGVNNLLVADASMDEALVYAILKTMFDNQKDLEVVHPEAKNLTLQNAVQGSPIDYHPGAIRFFREKGVWNR